MANFVIKKDGTKEPFDAEKIRKGMRTAATRTTLAPEKVEEAIEKVVSSVLASTVAKEEVSTMEIRGIALAEIDVVCPEIALSWREYDKQRSNV